jgi:predicted RNA polymerase sigma factor
VRDIGLAEELAQDALVAALEHWPRDGLPDNPAAWLMTTAPSAARSTTCATGRWPTRQHETSAPT